MFLSLEKRNKKGTISLAHFFYLFSSFNLPRKKNVTRLFYFYCLSSPLHLSLLSLFFTFPQENPIFIELNGASWKAANWCAVFTVLCGVTRTKKYITEKRSVKAEKEQAKKMYQIFQVKSSFLLCFSCLVKGKAKHDIFFRGHTHKSGKKEWNEAFLTAVITSPILISKTVLIISQQDNIRVNSVFYRKKDKINIELNMSRWLTQWLTDWNLGDD